MKILFIEDEKGYAYLIREYLKESPTDIDYELHHVMSLNKAIAELDKQQFDVILMDLGLPDSYGLASFEKLNHVNPDIPIIILTGYDIEEESIKAVSLGAQDYLVKDKINSYILKKSLRYSVERKKSQAALKESQEKYRMLFEDAGDYIFILNPDEDKGLIIKDANISAFSEHGYSREEMIGMPVLNLETEIFKRTINERRNLFKKPGDKAVFETEHIRKDGSVFPVEVSSRLLQIGNQKPFFLSIERNITERKKADEALKKSEELFHTIYDMEPECVKLLDGEGRLLEMNPAGLAMIQANLEQVQGGLAVNLVADEDKEAFNDMVNGVFRGEIRHLIFDMIGLKGRRLTLETTSVPLKDTDKPDSVKALLGVTRDITERRKAEQDRLSHLRFVESMDLVNRAIQGANGLEQMMNDSLAVVFSIFDCDRIWLFYPCDPDAETFRVPMEITKPEFPGAGILNVDLPMPSDLAQNLREILGSDEPLTYAAGSERPINKVSAEQFNVKSMMMVAIYPKTGKPWAFGLHHCRAHRIWTSEEIRLFKEISCRIADGLSSLLFLRDLKKSEQRYRMVFENSPVSIWEEDLSDIKTCIDNLKKDGIKDIDEYLIQHPETIEKWAGLVKIIDVNNASLILYDAGNKEELMSSLINIFTPESYNTFQKEIICLWNNEIEMQSDAVIKTLTGETRHVNIGFSVCPGYEGSLSKVLVSSTDITARKLIEDTLNLLATRFADLTGKSFFDAICAHLSKVLNIDYVFVGMLNNEMDKVKVIGGFALGKIMDELIYELKNTPCENVVSKETCIYNSGVMEKFPKDKMLQDMEIVSYIGSPIYNNKHEPMGILVGLNTKPLQETKDIVKLFEVFLERIAAEIQRSQAEESLFKSEERFRTIFKNHSAVKLLIDPNNGNIIDANDAASLFYGWTLDELNKMNIHDINMISFDDLDENINEVLHNQSRHFESQHRLKSGETRDVEVSSTQFIISGKAFLHSIIHDITNRKKAEMLIREREQRYRMVFENSPVSIWEEDLSEIKTCIDNLKKDGIKDIDEYLIQHPETIEKWARLVKIIDVNNASLILHDAGNKEELKTSLVKIFTPESFNTFQKEIVCLWNNENEMKSDAIVKTLAGERLHVNISFSVCPGYEESLSKVLVSTTDITERKLAEEQQNLLALILEHLNRQNEWQNLIRDIMREIKLFTGFDAVAIRLRKGNDYNYFEQNGFSEDFIKMDNFLCAKNSDGTIVRDEFGLPVLECTCGVVISGKTDSNKPYFTEGGSFWTNHSLNLIELLKDIDPRINSRKNCIKSDYMSIALVPICSGTDTIGLLQLNDRKPGRLTLDMIKFYEKIASAIGIAYHRIEAEESLRDSEEKYRQLVEISPDSILVVQNGLIVFANKSAVSMFGCNSFDDLLNQKIVNFAHPDISENSFDWIQDAIDKQKIIPRFDHKLRKVDGSLINVEISAIPYSYDENPALQIIIRDISERKRAEEALKDSEEKFRRIFKYHSAVKFLIDPGTGMIVDANDAASNYYGWSLDELKQMKIHKINVLPPEELDKKIDKVLKGESKHFEFRHKLKDGSIRDVEVSSTKINISGKFYLHSIIHDISERKRAEEALRESEELYRKLIMTVPDIILRTDLEGNILFVNETTFPSLGFLPKGRITGKNFLSFIDEKDFERAIENKNLMLEKSLGSQEYLLSFDEDIRIQCEVNGEILRDAFNNPYGIVFVVRDITERKRVEKSLKEYREKLEDLVKERTSQLEAVNKELESFSYSVSHDLRAPLRSIDGFSNALLEDYYDILDEEGKDFLKRIRNSTQSMGQLIDSLLSLSRLSRSEINYENINLSEIVEKIAYNLKVNNIGRDVEFIFKPNVIVNADYKLMEVFLTNLFVNAWKFTSKRDNPVIEFGEFERDGEKIYFVKDNGAGFDMIYSNKLFAPFQRLHSANEFEGTGIGLATAKRIISMHGGKIWADAGIDKGATFYFQF